MTVAARRRVRRWLGSWAWCRATPWVGVWVVGLVLFQPAPSPAVEGARLDPVGSPYPENRKALVFVHGVIGDPAQTWTHPNRTYWPKLAAQELKDFNVFVFGYYTPAVAPAPTIVQLAGQLTAALRAQNVLPTRYNEKYEKLYFVAHSMGNLIVRQALQRQADYRYVQVPLLLSLAAPSAGSELATIAQRFSRNPTVSSMSQAQLNDFLQALNDTWLDDHPRTEVACAFETLPWKGVKIVVTEASATAVCSRRPSLAITGDHENIVKPADARAEAHAWLTSQLATPWTPRGARKIVLMDHPQLAYDKKRFREEGKMNAQVVQEILRTIDLDGDIAPVEARWDEADTKFVLDKDPDLVIIHYSAFFGIPRATRDPEIVLTQFLRAVLTRSRAKVILYSRWAGEPGQFSADYRANFWSKHSGLPPAEAARAWRRMHFLDVLQGHASKDPKLDDPPVAHTLTKMVRHVLEIE